MSFIKRHWLQRMQIFSAALPWAYTVYLLMLTMIGYSFLLLFPALVVFPLMYLSAMIWQGSPLEWPLKDWLLVPGLLIISILAVRQSLQIFRAKLPLPSGRHLRAEEFPALHKIIDELRATYHAPRIHHVKLSTRFAIEVISTPHHGFPTRCTHTLLIGLPVMSCMSPLHFKFLLAREIGHFALGKLNFKRHIIFLESIWKQYATLYSEGWHLNTVLPRIFFAPFSALFTNSAYPAIQNESIIKDNCLLEITHTTNIAEVIVVEVIKQHYLQMLFWPGLNNRAFNEPKPPYMPYSAMDSFINKSLDKARLQSYYNTAVTQKPLPDSRQANLYQRLLAIGCDDFTVPEPKTENAGSHFLESKFSEILKQMDKIWYLENRTLWAMRHKRGAEEKVRLKSLHDQATKSLLPSDEAREYLLLVEKYISAEKALPYYMGILKTNAGDAHVCYEAGRLLLIAGNNSGVKALHRAMALSSEFTIDCYQQLIEYMSKTGHTEQAQKYRQKMQAYQAEF